MADISPIDLQKVLRGASYPTEPKKLAKLAKDNGADDSIVDKLEHASAQRFDGPNDVQKAIFG